MHQKWADEGLVVITVHVQSSLNKDELREKAAKFLRQKQARFSNLFFTDEKERQQLIAAAEIGGIPHVVVRDRAGHQRETFLGLKETELDDLVKKLLDEENPSGE